VDWHAVARIHYHDGQLGDSSSIVQHRLTLVQEEVPPACAFLTGGLPAAGFPSACHGRSKPFTGNCIPGYVLNTAMTA
jgi:hypothetical protein